MIRRETEKKNIWKWNSALNVRKREREKEKKMEEKEDQAQQANGTIMMRKYLLAKHEIMCIQWPRHVCKRANETEGERERVQEY